MPLSVLQPKPTLFTHKRVTVSTTLRACTPQSVVLDLTQTPHIVRYDIKSQALNFTKSRDEDVSKNGTV